MAVALLFLLCHAPGLRVGKLGRVLVLTYFSALRLDAEKCFGACVCVSDLGGSSFVRMPPSGQDVQSQAS